MTNSSALNEKQQSHKFITINDMKFPEAIMKTATAAEILKIRVKETVIILLSCSLYDYRWGLDW
jgi:hypothetical protein